MLKKPNYKKLDLQVYATFFEIYSGKASFLRSSSKVIFGTFYIMFYKGLRQSDLEGIFNHDSVYVCVGV